jgi:hypothetical protein
VNQWIIWQIYGDFKGGWGLLFGIYTILWCFTVMKLHIMENNRNMNNINKHPRIWGVSENEDATHIGSLWQINDGYDLGIPCSDKIIIWVTKTIWEIVRPFSKQTPMVWCSMMLNVNLIYVRFCQCWPNITSCRLNRFQDVSSNACVRNTAWQLRMVVSKAFEIATAQTYLPATRTKVYSPWHPIGRQDNRRYIHVSPFPVIHWAEICPRNICNQIHVHLRRYI